MQYNVAERGRHFLGVFGSGGSPVEFFRENGFAEETSQIIKFQTGESSGFGVSLMKDRGKSNFPSSITYTDGRIGVLFSGEIYNRDDLIVGLEELRTREDIPDDAEITGMLYEKYGMDFPLRINGIFSIVLMDFRTRTLVLYADRFGSAIPIYYHFSRKLVFGSQLKLLLRCHSIPAEIDHDSLAVFLKYSYIPAPRTIIRNIYKLCPGERVVLRDGQLKRSRYVDFNVKENPETNEKRMVESYIEKLKASIQRKMLGFAAERIGFFLSGGLDSSANVALAAMNGSSSFKTFGIGFNDPKVDERPYARLVARHFGVEFLESVFDGSEIEDLPRMVWYLDEPFMENGLFLTFAGFRAAHGKADLIIAGDGADQLFGTGGFAKGRPIALRYLLDRLGLRRTVGAVRDLALGINKGYQDNILFKLKVMAERAVEFNDWFFWGFDDRELSRLCRFSVSREGVQCFPNSMKEVPGTFDAYYQHVLVHQDIEHYVCQNVLVKSYRMAEMFGMTLRETYLDNEVIDFLVPMDMSLKTRGGLIDFLKGRRVTKYLHRLAMKDLLPGEILNKPKQGGFIPMEILLANSKRREAIFRYLLKSNVLQNYLNMDFIRNLLEKYEKSVVNDRTYWLPYRESRVNQIMNLLVFSLWHEICFKNLIVCPPDYSLSQFLKR